MHHFFVLPQAVEGDKVTITGPDVNHIRNALRMRQGESLLISDGEGNDYHCRISLIESGLVEARVIERRESRELPVRLYLFQGLPKSDKMELIIQKAVELGVYEIIPVITKNAVVKLDAKKERSRLERWQAISESAAKQSGRSKIPKVEKVMLLKEALEMAEGLDRILIPYENQSGIDTMRKALEETGEDTRSIAVFIGPEGGFDESEILLAKEQGAVPVSLGRRILRTETAGLAILSLFMMKAEGAF
ncbi:MAG: 16S rRNA (uracil(1498)-N(3))-methyltransferase [Lachnospiraceae bacterium]|jgi:16S rRNA (uracil1498-N3)-methyltransferase|nr:16S rRNA (uracil(1498)-N(3))-methyltransferase [Lachnospiraceae bacterium]